MIMPVKESHSGDAAGRRLAALLRALLTQHAWITYPGKRMANA
jgi:hypothetical protein